MQLSLPCLTLNCGADSNMVTLWIYMLLSLLVKKDVEAQTWAYTHYRALDYEGKYVLGWRYNQTDIEFEVSVQTLGYVGFGISKSGQMYPADMAIGWMSDGQMYLGDYHTTNADRIPYMDVSQDWIVQEGFEQNGTTVLRFSRKINTCDNSDEPITPDRMTVIWSYHENDPDVTSGMVPYHGPTRRGSRNIFLINDDLIPRSYPPPQTFMMDFTNYEFTIPATGSTLQCRVFQKGAIPESHLIKYEPIITPGNEAYVYRMTFYRCDMKDVNLSGQVFDCENGAPVQVKSCKTIVATWSMGGEAFHFPEGVGVSLGAPGDASDYVLEIQYSKFQEEIGENGTPINVPDSSGVRITYTTSPITHKAGIIELGKVVSPGWKQIILDGEPTFTTKSYCSPRCMEWGFASDQSPINVFGAILKGNDVARGVKIRHFRQSEELPWIIKDDSFSNFFQAPRSLTNIVSVKSTDTLSVECTYNTTERQGVTRGGWSRVEELCRATLMYYPAKPFDMCLSWSSYDQLRTKTGELIPENEAVDYLSNVTSWNPQMKRQFKDALDQSSERSICSSIIRQPAYAIDRFNLPALSKVYSKKTPCTKTV